MSVYKSYMFFRTFVQFIQLTYQFFRLDGKQYYFSANVLRCSLIVMPVIFFTLRYMASFDTCSLSATFSAVAPPKIMVSTLLSITSSLMA